MRKDQKLRGAALLSAAQKKAKKTGYSVSFKMTGGKVRTVMRDGSYRDGKDGGFMFCANFGPGSR